MDEYPHIVTKICSTPWLITMPSLKMILSIVEKRINGVPMSDEEIRNRINSAVAGSSRGTGRVQGSGGVGILPLYGPIFPRANMMTEMSGATSLQTFKQNFRNLMDNDLVSTIVMDIDSPGGMADLVHEMGEEIREAREDKRIIAVANTDAYSAAYWLGSQANEFYATPSGGVGSVGTYMVHEDWSGNDAKEGVKTTFIVSESSPHKVAGNMHEPLTATAKEHWQSIVEQCQDMFLEAVAQGRDVSVETVKSTYGGGKTVTARDALHAGMIDGVATLDDVVGMALEDASQSSVPSGMAARSARRSNAIRASEAPMEHSEPGTGQGGEPTPREPDATDTPDPAIEEGWRRDTPPIVEELEGSAMNREQLVALATSLGVPVSEDMTDDALASAIQAQADTFQPLVEATQEGTRAQSFREAYPEEYSEMQRLREGRQETDAHAFADRYERFADESGKTSNRGFSQLVLGGVRELHVKLANRTATEEDLQGVLDSIANDGIVEYGERGSSRQNDPRERGNLQNMTVLEKRQAFATLVRERMDQDGLTMDAAIKAASQEDPELAEAYHAGHVQK